MPVMTESVHTGEFLLSEGNLNISRELVELAPSLTMLSGTVMGKDTANDIYKPLDVDASDGTQMAAGILWDHKTTDATGGEGVLIARLAEVDQERLIWPDDITDEQKATAVSELAALDIILRQ